MVWPHGLATHLLQLGRVRSSFLSNQSFIDYSIFILDAATAVVRPERIKRTKPSVRLILDYSPHWVLMTLQPKRPRPSKETIVNSDEEDIIPPTAGSLGPTPSSNTAGSSSNQSSVRHFFYLFSLGESQLTLRFQPVLVDINLNTNTDVEMTDALAPCSGTSESSSVSQAAVCLPFSSVPGMDTSSRMFQKAMLLLNKKKPSATLTTKSSCRSLAADRGKIHSFSRAIRIRLINSICLDLFLGSTGEFDREAIRRTRDFVSHAVIQEIQKEDPDSPAAYQDAIRHQIVSNCQRLRVCLMIVDQLMEVFNHINDPKGKSPADKN